MKVIIIFRIEHRLDCDMVFSIRTAYSATTTKNQFATIYSIENMITRPLTICSDCEFSLLIVNLSLLQTGVLAIV